MVTSIKEIGEWGNFKVKVHINIFMGKITTGYLLMEKEKVKVN